MSQHYSNPRRASKRQLAIAIAADCGYHGDTRKFTRLIIEARVARTTLNAAWSRGAAARLAGVACHCPECASRSVSNV
jgi:hypothetical protein